MNGHPHWIVVFVPAQSSRGVESLFKITRVQRIQAPNEALAMTMADRIEGWRMVSVAKEVHVVY